MAFYIIFVSLFNPDTAYISRLLYSQMMNLVIQIIYPQSLDCVNNLFSFHFFFLHYCQTVKEVTLHSPHHGSRPSMTPTLPPPPVISFSSLSGRRHSSKVSHGRRRSCHSSAEPCRGRVFLSQALTPTTQRGSWAELVDGRATGSVPNNSCASSRPAWQNTYTMDFCFAVGM